MKIQINTDQISGSEGLIQHAESVVESTLGHLADHITRIEVHISDQNGNKGGDHDKRCLMEARLKGHQPVAVTNEAGTIGQAISGAADKLKSSLDHTLGRLSDHEGRKHLKVRTSNALVDDSGEMNAE
jgi:ribosome-associated translation inhibitor RaiA